MDASVVLIVSACLFLAIGVPVAFALGMATAATLILAESYPLIVLLKETFTGIDSFPLMAVPFFILAAELMSGGSLTEVLLRFAGQFVGHKRGGLGYTNVNILDVPRQDWPTTTVTGKDAARVQQSLGFGRAETGAPEAGADVSIRLGADTPAN